MAIVLSYQLTNPIILGSDFLDTQMLLLLDIGDCIITLHCAIITCLPPASPMSLYMISTLVKIVDTGYVFICYTIEVSYK